MSNGKDMLQEAVKTLYKEGKRVEEIRAIFKPAIEKNERIYAARDSIVQGIFTYIDAVHSDMFNTYTKEDLDKFVMDQIFNTIDKDLEELRSLKDDGYKKVASGDNRRDIKPVPGLEGYDDEALNMFLRSL